jgi:hypothetical protein
MRESTLVELESESDGEDDAAIQPPPAAEQAATTAADELMIAAATTDNDTAVAADAAAESEYDAGAGATTEPAPAMAIPAAPVPDTTVPTAAAAPTTAAARLVVIVTEVDLIELADAMKTTPLDADDAESQCSGGALKADATFEDDDGATHPIVVVAIGDGTIGALALDDCDIVLEADL